MSDESTEASEPFDRAVALHEAGRFAEAIELYRSVVEAEGEDPVVLELLGTALAAIGDSSGALRQLDRSIELDPSSATVFLQRGAVRESLGEIFGAIEDYRVAVRIEPESPEAAARLGALLHSRGELEGAWAAMARPLAAAPDNRELRRLHANVAMALGRFGEAEEDLDRLLAVLPEDPTGLALLARLRASQGRPRDAVQIARRAFEAAPDLREARLNLSTALTATGDAADAEKAMELATGSGSEVLPERDRERISALAEISLGQPDRAAERMRRWTSVEADDAEALGVLASALRLGGDLEAAVVAARRAVALLPSELGFLVELGRFLLEKGDADAAIAAFERAWTLGGRTAAVTIEMVNALKRRGLLGRAIRMADEVVREGASDPELGMARVMLLHDAGRHREAVEEGERFAEDEHLAPSHLSNHLFGLQYPDHVEEQRVTQSHARLAVRISAAEPGPWRVDRDAERTLRIGFVSADLKAHSVAWFLRPLLRHVDRERLHTVAYSNTGAADLVTEQLRSETREWRTISGRRDADVAESIREDRIDVLVDLGGHTANNRLGVFRHAPAPVQMTWLGYPNTTGVPEIAWRVVDALTDPPGTEDFASEALLRMKAPFLCFDRDMVAIDIPDRPARPVVFGSFNNTAKLSDRCLELWSEALRSVPDARLLLKSRAFEDPEFRAPMLDRLEHFGVPSRRVDLVGFTPGLAAHHLAYASIDIALDTFPYHGTTTTCEALWNGVPVVSRIGEVHRARVGKTLLHAVGLPELACEDDDSFVQAAARLAADVAWRRSLHADLRDRMKSSPLCDGAGFARRFEAATRHAWRCWCRGEAPEGVFLSSDA